MSSNFMSAQYWRERAEEARVKAEQMTSPDAKASLLRMAQRCDELAARAEAVGNVDEKQTLRAPAAAPRQPKTT